MTTTNGDTRTAARTAAYETLKAGKLLTGAQIAEEFGMSGAWGSERIREARAQLAEESAQQEQIKHSRPSRLIVWAAFLLGIGASVAANVAHAQPTAGARIAGAFFPLALLLAVEVMSRPVWNRTGFLWGLARYGATGLVAIVAAIVSYRHMSGLLLQYGEDSLSALLGPLSVDGLMVVSGFALLAMAKMPKS